MNRKITQRLRFCATSLSTIALVTGCASGPVSMGNLQPVYRVQGQQSTLGSHSFYEQGKQHFISQRYGLALQAFQSELVRKPNSVQALNGIAACYDKMRRYDLAANYYYQTLEIEPDSVRTLSNLGYSYILQGKHADAKKVLSLALKKEPANAVARRHLALVSDQPSDLNNTLVAIATLPEKATMAEVQASVNDESAIKESVTDSQVVVPVVESPAVAKVVEPVVEALLPTVAKVVEPVAEGPLPVVTTMIEPIAEEPLPTVAAVGEPILDVTKPSQELASPAVAEAETINAAPVMLATTVADISVTDNVDDVVNYTELMPFGIAIAETTSTDQAGLSSSTNVATVSSLLKDNTDVAQAVSFDNPQVAGKLAERATLVKAATFITEDESARPMYTVHNISAESHSQDVKLLTPQPTNGGMTIEWKDDTAAGQIIRQKTSDVARIELSNGNGREGLARQLRNILSSRGEVIKTTSNADRYDYKETVIYYTRGKLAAAQKLSNSLPLQVRFEETSSNHQNVDITVLIGEDFPDYGDVGRTQVEVSNGTGLEGLARHMRVVLRGYGEAVNRVTDAEHYNHDKTVIYYSVGKLEEAERLARRLPVKTVLHETRKNRNDVDVRLVLGSDLLIHEFAMRKKLETDV